MFKKIKTTIIYSTIIFIVTCSSFIDTGERVGASGEASNFTVDMKFNRDVNETNPLVLMQEEYIDLKFSIRQSDAVVRVGDTFTVILPEELEVVKTSKGTSYTVENIIKDDLANKDIARILYSINKNEVKLEVTNLYSYEGNKRNDITASKFNTFFSNLTLPVRLVKEADKLEFTLPKENTEPSKPSNVTVDNTTNTPVVTNKPSMQQRTMSLMASPITGDIDLTIPNINPLGAFKLEAETKTVTTGMSGPVIVTDSRSTDSGWRLDVSASQFKVVEPVGGFANGTSANILPVGSVHLSQVQAIKSVATGNEITLTDTLATKSIIDDGVITVTKALAGNGVGGFNIEFPTDALSITLDPTSTKVDKVNYPASNTPYESIITWSLISAP